MSDDFSQEQANFKTPDHSNEKKIQTATSLKQAQLAEQESHNREDREDWEATLENLDLEGNWSSSSMSLADVSKIASTSDVRGRYHQFQTRREEFWRNYALRGQERTEPVEENFHFFGDWSTQKSSQSHIDWPERKYNNSGLYFRWNGVGIALNPTADFLRDFHKRELYIGDIHIAISTRPDPEIHSVLEQIYTLNATYNEVSQTKHKIDYYLCAGSHKELFHRLEPRYKQERNSVFCLEKYVDSDEIETHNLGQGIALSYSYGLNGSEAGVVFQLALPKIHANSTNEGDQEPIQTVKLGYLPLSLGVQAPPSLFENCHLLVVSLGSLQSHNSLETGELNLEPLTHSLNTLLAKVVLLSDFSTDEGDLRLEISKHLKSQIGEKRGGDMMPILPADGDLQLEMATWRIRCAVTNHWIPAPFAHVVRLKESFGPLMYLGSDCVL